MSNAETEAMRWPQTAPAAERSVLVTVAGVLLLLLPYAAFAAAIIFATPQSPLSMALRTRDFPISAVAIGLVPLAVFTLIALAIIRRWRGWRIYAGTLAWLMIITYFMSLSTLPRTMAFRGGVDEGAAWFVLFASVWCVIGMFILLAKREEPPEMTTSPVTPVGVALIAFGLICLAGLFFGTSTSDKTVSGVASVLFAGTGLSMLRRWPGWRIYLGLIAWCLIGIAVLYALSLLIELLDGLFKAWHTQTSPLELLDKGGTVLWVIAFGYFLLWVKRSERSLDNHSQVQD